MIDDERPPLPERQIVRVDFGTGPRHPAVRYVARADVIARFVTALREWNPHYSISIEPLEPDDIGLPPEFPVWQLWAWDEGEP